MKKAVMILLICSCLSAKAIAGAAVIGECARGHGDLLLDDDKITTYCRSKVRLNWWSAFTWCKAAGGRLIDINKDCSDTGCGKYSFLNAYRTWTANQKDESTAFSYCGWTGIITYQKADSGGNNSTLCIMKQ